MTMICTLPVLGLPRAKVMDVPSGETSGASQYPHPVCQLVYAAIVKVKAVDLIHI